MKKILLLLGLGILLSACNNEVNEKVSTEDTEKTLLAEEVPDGIQAEIIPFDSEETPKEADLVAEIIIGDKLEEVEEKPVPYTLFKAEIKEVIEGVPVSQNIVIKQQGNSEWVFNDNELFAPGEEYIFFLKETTVSKGDYWILGEETGMFQVFGNEEVVKLADPLEEFEDIEIDLEESEKIEINSDNQEEFEEQQVLDKESFIEKIQVQGGE